MTEYWTCSLYWALSLYKILGWFNFKDICNAPSFKQTLSSAILLCTRYYAHNTTVLDTIHIWTHIHLYVYQCSSAPAYACVWKLARACICVNAHARSPRPACHFVGMKFLTETHRGLQNSSQIFPCKHVEHHPLKYYEKEKNWHTNKNKSWT
jgi:hypothetical protein